MKKLNEEEDKESNNESNNESDCLKSIMERIKTKCGLNKTGE